MKDKELKNQLQDEVGGKWKKVYEWGRDSDGIEYQIHYFMNEAGKIFNPKIKSIDKMHNLNIPLK